jgi:hypothetical protein
LIFEDRDTQYEMNNFCPQQKNSLGRPWRQASMTFCHFRKPTHAIVQPRATPIVLRF